MFGWYLRTGEDPGDDGPRAVISQFVGLWMGGALLFWSFVAAAPGLRLGLRVAAAAAAVGGIVLSACYGEKTEVDETPADKVTGFKNDTTDLHLN